MRHTLRMIAPAALAGLCLVGAESAARAADKPGWYSATDLSFVLSAGNTETSTLGIKSDLTRQWLRTAWKTTASVVRTDVGEPTRQAIGTTLADVRLEKGPRVTKAEKIFVNTDFERRITERFYWNVGGSGERDKFAGLRSRFTGAAGIGYIWENRDNARFRTGVAGTYTSEDVVTPKPDTEDLFPGLRLTADGERRFGDTNQHVFASQLVVDENLKDTEDLRVNWGNSLAVAISRRLALQVGVQLAYDNQPALVEFPIILLQGPNRVETPNKLNGDAEKLDTTFTVSLVINFAPGGGAARPGTR